MSKVIIPRPLLVVTWIVLTAVLAAMLCNSGCAAELVEPEDIVEPTDLAGIAEQYCKDHPELPCGHVWDCGNTNIPEQPDSVEICVLNAHPIELAADYYGGTCAPAAHPRFNGHPLCWWCAGEGCGAGCNAYQGCWAPTVEMP